MTTTVTLGTTKIPAWRLLWH